MTRVMSFVGSAPQSRTLTWMLTFVPFLDHPSIIPFLSLPVLGPMVWAHCAAWNHPGGEELLLGLFLILCLLCDSVLLSTPFTLPRLHIHVKSNWIHEALINIWILYLITVNYLKIAIKNLVFKEYLLTWGWSSLQNVE